MLCLRVPPTHVVECEASEVLAPESTFYSNLGHVSLMSWYVPRRDLIGPWLCLVWQWILS